MKSYILPGLAGAALLAVSACSNNNNSTPPLTGAFRAVNGMPNSSGLDASIAGVSIPTQAQNISFGTGSSISDVPNGSYNVTLSDSAAGSTSSSSSSGSSSGSSSSSSSSSGSGSSSSSGGGGTVSFDVDNLNISSGNLETVFTYGDLSTGTQNGFIAEESLQAPTNGQVVMQVVHDALTESSTASTLSFYFVKPGSGLTGASPTTAPFAQQPNPESIPLAGGTYEIIVTNGTTTVFDSGPKGVALPASGSSANVFQLAALDATSAQSTQYGSTVTLLLLDNNGGNTPLYNGQN
jgi:hypothetical protein